MPPPQPPPLKKQKRRWLRRIIGLMLAAIIIFCVDYWAFPYGAAVHPLTRVVSGKENGLWLRYSWYFGEKSADEMQNLPTLLHERQIRSAWFHVRAIGKTGKLNFRYVQRAQKLNAVMHPHAPEIRSMAWVYIGNKRGAGEVDLSNVETRRQMVAEAVWLTTDCEFDGVHWDYEICDDNDADFLNLLRETRITLTKDKLISVATPMWLPAPLGRWGWSEAYFVQVAALCDEIAVMCYDSGFLTPRSYVWLTAQQPSHITQAVAKGNPNCRVIFSVPTCGQGFFSHNPRAENLRFALRGIRQGLNDPQTDLTVFAGLAPFADYTTELDEWETWQKLWLNDLISDNK